MELLKFDEMPNDSYLVVVPTIMTYTAAEIELIGIPAEMIDGVHNKKQYSETTKCVLPLKRILEIYSYGFKISVVNSEDITTIYNVLSDYATRVTTNSLRTLNREPIDVAEIEMIDNFLAEVFDLNRHSIVKNNAPSKSGFSVGNGMGVKGMGFAPYSQDTIDDTPIVRGRYDDLGTYTKQPIPNYYQMYDNVPDIDPTKVTRERITIPKEYLKN